MTSEESFPHLLFCQSPCEMHAVFQLPLPDQIPEILSVGGDLQLLLQRVVCRQIISRHIHLHIGELPADPGQCFQEIMQALQRIISLTDEDAVGFTVLRVPAAFIEGSAQGLIHRIILCSGIPPGGHLPVPCRPAGDISRQTDGFSLHHTSADEFLLLAAQAVPFHQIPEGHFARHTLREISEIGFRTEAADPLDPQKDPLRMRIDTADRQRMGIFCTKAVDHIRIIIFRDLTQFFFQLRLVTVRMHGILMEAVASDEISTAPLRSRCSFRSRSGFRDTGRVFPLHPDYKTLWDLFPRGNRERHCQRHADVFPVHDLRQQSGQPAFLIGSFSMQCLGDHREHDIADPQYSHKSNPLLIKYPIQVR